ncbi:MAG: hypothetical protein ACRDT0_12370 [Pseudonocardiaceae bacterium]
MSRPWMWALTPAGQLHATTVVDCSAGVEVPAVCGDAVMVGAVLVDVCGAHADPCLCCVQLLPCGGGS